MGEPSRGRGREAAADHGATAYLSAPSTSIRIRGDTSGPRH
jgi:hypothetical protein